MVTADPSRAASARSSRLNVCTTKLVPYCWSWWVSRSVALALTRISAPSGRAARAALRVRRPARRLSSAHHTRPKRRCTRNRSGAASVARAMATLPRAAVAGATAPTSPPWAAGAAAKPRAAGAEPPLFSVPAGVPAVASAAGDLPQVPTGGGCAGDAPAPPAPDPSVAGDAADGVVDGGAVSGAIAGTDAAAGSAEIVSAVIPRGRDVHTRYAP